MAPCTSKTSTGELGEDRGSLGLSSLAPGSMETLSQEDKAESDGAGQSTASTPYPTHTYEEIDNACPHLL